MQDWDKALEEVDMEVTEMIKAVRRSEENYERGQEQAKNRDEQLRLTRQTSRQDFNSLMLINSTPIRNSNTRTDQPAIHFDTNATHHIYPTITTANADRYEPPPNNSILQGAGSAPGGQFVTNTTGATGPNNPVEIQQRSKYSHTHEPARMHDQINQL